MRVSAAGQIRERSSAIVQPRVLKPGGETARTVMPGFGVRFGLIWGSVNVIGVGIDLVDVGRIERVLERRPRFAERVFSEEERAYCDRSPTVRATCYAARWAAREACVKALGGVPGGWRWHDIRVVRRRGGAPEMELHGPARTRARAIGAERLLVSFSHERDAAVAMCMALGGDVR